jgi:hypothetical protein
MNITDQDIIRTAQQLRDEENEQLHVRPEFNRTRPWRRIPSWLIAIPAAAIVGFFVGIWTDSSQNDAPLTTHTDTVYVQVPMPQTQKEPTPLPNPNEHTTAPTQTVHKSVVAQSPQASLGHSIADDNIRYDLLVRN